MDTKNRLEIDIRIITPENVNLRTLEELRLDLAKNTKSNFRDNELDIYQEPASRSLDPAVVGALALAITPILLEKLADVLIQWIEHHKEVSVTLSIPIKGAHSITITYNPAKTNPEALRKWIKSAKETLKMGKS